MCVRKKLHVCGKAVAARLYGERVCGREEALRRAFGFCRDPLIIWNGFGRVLVFFFLFNRPRCGIVHF